MGIKSFLKSVFKGKRDHHQAPEVAAESASKDDAGATVYADPDHKSKAEHPATEGILAKIAHAIKSRSMRRLEKGEGMLSVKGHYMSPNDVRCLEIMGCDLGVLAELHLGETPTHAPNATTPHPLSDEYKAELKAKKDAKRMVKEIHDEAHKVEVQEVVVADNVPATA